MRDRIIYLLLGGLFGIGIAFLLMGTRNQTETESSISTIDFKGFDMIPFDLELLGYKQTYDKELHILFYEDKFCIKSGETFYYNQAIQSYKGKLAGSHDKSYDHMQKGNYLVRYVVYDELNDQIKKEYVKLLVVY